MALRILMQPSDLEAVCNCKDDQPGSWARIISLTFRLFMGCLGFWGFGVLEFWGFGVLGFWGFGVLGFKATVNSILFLLVVFNFMLW